MKEVKLQPGALQRLADNNDSSGARVTERKSVSSANADDLILDRRGSVDTHVSCPPTQVRLDCTIPCAGWQGTRRTVALRARRQTSNRKVYGHSRYSPYSRSG